jgi:hypothetical protein
VPVEGARCGLSPAQTCTGYGSFSCPLTATCSSGGTWQIECPAVPFGLDAGTCGCAHPQPGDAGPSCSGAPVITPDSYDNTCSVDSDCVGVPGGGSACDPCAFACALAPLSDAGALAYRADFQQALATYAPGAACAVGCPANGPGCCVAGQCALGAACAADASGPDANTCGTAPTITPDAYDKSCQSDGDCVAVPAGGDTCDRCAFACPGEALSDAGAVRYRVDYTAALQTYAMPVACPGACREPGSACCVAGQCRLGTTCATEAGATDSGAVDAADAAAP